MSPGSRFHKDDEFTFTATVTVRRQGVESPHPTAAAVEQALRDSMALQVIYVINAGLYGHCYIDGITVEGPT